MPECAQKASSGKGGKIVVVGNAFNISCAFIATGLVAVVQFYVNTAKAQLPQQQCRSYNCVQPTACGNNARQRLTGFVMPFCSKVSR